MIADLNRAILSLAPAFKAQASAPNTFADLMRAPSLIVWDGASATTIYGCERVNHAARAWHDSIHKRYGFDFSLAGERATCEAQLIDLLQHFPSTPPIALALLRAEVIGQAEYFTDYGRFPVDQAAFVAAYLESKNHGTYALH